jgi:hypothetical protein
LDNWQNTFYNFIIKDGITYSTFQTTCQHALRSHLNNVLDYMRGNQRQIQTREKTMKMTLVQVRRGQQLEKRNKRQKVMMI